MTDHHVLRERRQSFWRVLHTALVTLFGTVAVEPGHLIVGRPSHLRWKAFVLRYLGVTVSALPLTILWLHLFGILDSPWARLVLELDQILLLLGAWLLIVTSGLTSPRSTIAVEREAAAE